MITFQVVFTIDGKERIKLKRDFESEGDGWNEFTFINLQNNLRECALCGCEGCKQFVRDARELLEKFQF